MVRFLSASSALSSEEKRKLVSLAKFLHSDPKAQILLVGHSDRHGNDRVRTRVSLSRVRAVQEALEAQGISRARIDVEAAGFTAPLSEEPNAASDRRNRRVEIWIKPSDPIALVSWIFGVVQARPPDVARWRKAELEMPLHRFYNVRTVQDSAGEVTFHEGNKLFIGPGALVVIYGREKKRRTRKKRSSDVVLKEGELFVRLAQLEGAPVEVVTDAAEIKFQSRRARVRHNPKKKVSQVSVYEGSADVLAQGKSVRVERGQGTRVQQGRAPEPPSLLIEPPKWTLDEPLLVVEQEPTILRWDAATGTSTTVAELFAYDDQALSRAIKTWRLARPGMRLLSPKPGAYRVRLTAVDRRGVLGMPGKLRTLLVVPRPKMADGRTLALFGARRVMPFPGMLSFSAPEGARIEWDPGVPLDDNGRLHLSTPKQWKLPFVMITDGGRTTEPATLSVEVAPMKLSLDSVGPLVELTRGKTVSVRLFVHDGQGVPLAGRRLFATVEQGERGGALGSRSPGGDVLTSGLLSPCHCKPPPRALQATEVQDGLYVFSLMLPWGTLGPKNAYGSAGLSPARTLLRVIDEAAQGEQWVEFEASPIAASPQGEEQSPPFFLGASLGGGLQNGNTRPSAFLELGAGTWMEEAFRVFLSTRVGYGRSMLSFADKERDLHRVPILARVTLESVFAGVRPFVAGAAGISWVGFRRGADDGTLDLEAFQLAWNGALGVSLRVGDGEVVIEAAYEGIRIRGSQIPSQMDFRKVLHQGGFYFGYRWYPWGGADPQ